jgi:hypothetical protein
MPDLNSFSEELDKINEAFPAVLHCLKCDRPQQMKIERGADKLVHLCAACGMARQRTSGR